MFSLFSVCFMIFLKKLVDILYNLMKDRFSKKFSWVLQGMLDELNGAE